MPEDVAEEATLVATPRRETPPAVDPDVPTLQTYRLGELLGKGGMGEVVLAHDPRIGREVALKRLRGDAPSEEAVSRFLREAKIQARLDHPAIVPVHELGRDAEGRPYFTMKRLAGTTLSAKLATETLQALLRAFVDVCLAVDLAHSRKVVHRDLKPSNIMLGNYGEVYVLDWGVARVLDSADPESPSHDIPSLGGETQTGDLLGTPGYMAPEQVRGGEIGTAADIYALGSILFEILAREPLHPRGHAAIGSTLAGSVNPSPAKRKPDSAIPPELDALCIEALDDDPLRRPTARALADRVQNYLDGDRDQDRRRAQAKELVEAGRAELAGGNRAEAVRLGGRALALDPQSAAAAELVLSLVIDPPPDVPKEVEPILAEEERAARRQRSKRAIAPYLAPFALSPLLLVTEIASTAQLALFYASTFMMAAIAWRNARTGTFPVWLYLTAHLFTVVFFSRISGPFVLTPMLLCAILLSVTALPWLNDRVWSVVVGSLLGFTLPFAVEWIGLFEPSWEMIDGGVLSRGTMFHLSNTGISQFLANALLLSVVGLYARGISRDRREAQRRLHVQAWHLKQLLPRT